MKGVVEEEEEEEEKETENGRLRFRLVKMLHFISNQADVLGCVGELHRCTCKFTAMCYNFLKKMYKKKNLYVYKA